MIGPEPPPPSQQHQPRQQQRQRQQTREQQQDKDQSSRRADREGGGSDRQILEGTSGPATTTRNMANQPPPHILQLWSEVAENLSKHQTGEFENERVGVNVVVEKGGGDDETFIVFIRRLPPSHPPLPTHPFPLSVHLFCSSLLYVLFESSSPPPTFPPSAIYSNRPPLFFSRPSDSNPTQTQNTNANKN